MENNENFDNFAEQPVEDTNESKTSSKKNWKKEVMDWVVSIVLAIIIALIMRNFVFTLVEVDGESMYPTLEDGDRLFTRIIAYNRPQQGDIIIFNPSISEEDRSPNKDTAYVKRVIALEGQTVDIQDGKVIVDGVILEEDYISEEIYGKSQNATEFPFTVPKGTVFVLGDNRNRSHDSRSKDVGAVPLDNIIGKAQLRLLPFETFGTLY